MLSVTGSHAANWREMASGRRRRPADRLLIALLAPFAMVYATIQRLRALLYTSGFLCSRHLPRPVISIGNLAVGGTGKTPVTAHVARLLIGKGYRVAVLSRGYGGTLEGETAIVSDGENILLGPERCGDEPYLLASQLPGLLVVIGADRYEAGLLAMRKFSPDLFLLDDGYQHLRLHRDLNILLLDCLHPYGNGWTLPAGLLREPCSAAGRATLVLHTRCPDGSPITAPVPGKPNLPVRYHLAAAVPLAGGKPLPLAALAGKRLLAFAGIAEPDGFFAALRAAGLDIVQTIAFADHEPYGINRMEHLRTACNGTAPDGIVTTSKDSVKLGALPPELLAACYAVTLELQLDDPAQLSDPILNLLQK